MTETATTLIAKNSSLYLKRLVKEVRANFLKGGVYYTDSKGSDVASGRICNIRFSALNVWVRTDFDGKWMGISDYDGFRNGYGEDIVASRHIKH